ncbi:unnamed protein product [Cylicocyclus nassatus]|uniref:Uncharacterized protein n=1 Tax=Cylicocyclus nassatus TaxID=53992 RepID=A0AA36MDY9_CYLNA|nr:unnamed protein product [Cylicocyclus nassatus]
MQPAVVLRYAAIACIATSAFALDPAAFQRVFNGTSLSSSQIDQLAKAYNDGLKKSQGKEAGEAFIASLNITDKKALTDKFLDLRKKDLLLRNLHSETMKSIKDVVSKEIKNKVAEWKAKAEKLYKGDFSKSQISVVRTLLEEVPAKIKKTVETKINEPLQKFKSQKSMEGLLSAIATFHSPK